MWVKLEQYVGAVISTLRSSRLPSVGAPTRNISILVTQRKAYTIIISRSDVQGRTRLLVSTTIGSGALYSQLAYSAASDAIDIDGMVRFIQLGSRR